PALADQFATIAPPPACSESDRANGWVGPAKIPLYPAQGENRPSAAAMELACLRSARSFPPCAHRAHAGYLAPRFDATPRRSTGFRQDANENTSATLRARSFPLFH